MRINTRLITLAALLATVALPSPALAQGAGPGMAVPTGPISVKVVKVSPSGATAPFVGAEVVVELWVGQGGRMPDLSARASGMVGIQLAAASIQVSGSDGIATFPSQTLGVGQRLTVSVLADGHTFGGQPIEPGKPSEIRVYDRTEDVSSLSSELLIGLFVDERMVVADVTLTFHNDSPQIIDVEQQGLRLPMVLPAVRGWPVEGVLPDGALRHIANQREPIRGRISMEKGSVVYRGPILPGRGQKIRLRYGIPIENSRQGLGIVSKMDSTRVRVISRWSKRIAPQVVPGRSFTAFERDQGEQRQRQIVIDDPLPAGTPLLLNLDRLPYAVGAESAVALIGSLVLLALFGFALLSPSDTPKPVSED